MTCNEMALMVNIAVDMQKNEVNDVLDKIRAEIEEQIERDFNFAKTEEVKVPVHYGTANGLQVAVRIIDKYRKGDKE